MIIYNTQQYNKRYIYIYMMGISRYRRICTINEFQNPKGNTYSLFEFTVRFGSIEACEQELFRLKWPEGFRCHRFSCDRFSIVGGRRLPLYQCSGCHNQTMVTVGTNIRMHKTVPAEAVPRPVFCGYQ